jgi:hypothetical protein
MIDGPDDSVPLPVRLSDDVVVSPIVSVATVEADWVPRLTLEPASTVRSPRRRLPIVSLRVKAPVR